MISPRSGHDRCSETQQGIFVSDAALKTMTRIDPDLERTTHRQIRGTSLPPPKWRHCGGANGAQVDTPAPMMTIPASSTTTVDVCVTGL